MGGFHHPAVQFCAVAGLEAEQFFAWHIQACHLLFQFVVIYQRGQFLAVVFIEGDYGGGVDV